MTNLLTINNDNVVYIENDEGVVFGVVSSLIVLDEDGLKYEQDTITVLERNGFNPEQDLESETTYIYFTQSNGDIDRLGILKDNVFLK